MRPSDKAPPVEIAAYAPLTGTAGLPRFGEDTRAWRPTKLNLEAMGLAITATASAGEVRVRFTSRRRTLPIAATMSLVARPTLGPIQGVPWRDVT